MSEQEYFMLDDNNLIVNVIVCDASYAQEHQNIVEALPGYRIGDTYPTIKSIMSQLQAAQTSAALLEDCLVEMAGIVYA